MDREKLPPIHPGEIFLLKIIPLTLVSFLLCSCNPQHDSIEPATATPTPRVFADTFFSGCAYLDSNDNGEIDPDDLLLEDAMFVVTLNGGAGFGGLTSENYCATVTVPGGLDEKFWPVTVRMEPPEGTGYQLVSPAEIVVEYPEDHADFLFTNPQ